MTRQGDASHFFAPSTYTSTVSIDLLPGPATVRTMEPFLGIRNIAAAPAPASASTTAPIISPRLLPLCWAIGGGSKTACGGGTGATYGAGTAFGGGSARGRVGGGTLGVGGRVRSVDWRAGGGAPAAGSGAGGMPGGGALCSNERAVSSTLLSKTMVASSSSSQSMSTPGFASALAGTGVFSSSADLALVTRPGLLLAGTAIGGGGGGITMLAVSSSDSASGAGEGLPMEEGLGGGGGIGKPPLLVEVLEGGAGMLLRGGGGAGGRLGVGGGGGPPAGRAPGATGAAKPSSVFWRVADDGGAAGPRGAGAPLGRDFLAASPSKTSRSEPALSLIAFAL